MLNTLKTFSEQLISPDLFVKKRYRAFQELLGADRAAHTLLAELEEVFYACKPVDINHIRRVYRELSAEVASMLTALHGLAPGRYRNLSDYYRKIDFYARFALAPPRSPHGPPYILPIDDHYPDDRQTGGKALHLSHLTHQLHLPVPDGFIVSTAGWNLVVDANDLRGRIRTLLEDIDIAAPAALQRLSATLTGWIETAEIPVVLGEEIDQALEKLKTCNCARLFAVRSSGVGEDSVLSFAGQYRSRLNVPADQIKQAYRQVLASKYTPEALLYRIMHGLDDEEMPMAVIVLVMVDARLSGVATTADPAGLTDEPATIHWVGGLGDKLMSGQATAASARLGETGAGAAAPQALPAGREHGPPPDELARLAAWGKRIAAHYGGPQEIEWSSTEDGALYLLQARALARHPGETVEQTPVPPDLPVLYEGGRTASPGICSGRVCRFRSTDDPSRVANGSILITETTPPALVTLLPVLSGVIARYGSSAGHFSSVAREFGVPVLVEADDEILDLDDGGEITLWAERRTVYRGLIPHQRVSAEQSRLPASPLHRTLKMVLSFTSPLALIDPAAAEFRPENCRSLHDIIRFSHEKAVEAMFSQAADGFLRKPKGVRLQTDIPLQILVIDVGGNVVHTRSGDKTVPLAAVGSAPLQALYRGLSHPGIDWSDRSHFDWRSYDAISLAGGIAQKDDADLASFCLVSADYLNVNLRFGYHFALLDCFCPDTADENYILLRFAGGGGTGTGKDLRLDVISQILTRLDFSCERSGELLDGRFMRFGRKLTLATLEQVGHLLGAVRLLDMALKREGDVAPLVESFFRGHYNFSSEA